MKAKCPQCGKVCKNELGLSFHISKVHKPTTAPAEPTEKKPRKQKLSGAPNFCPRCGYCLAAIPPQ